MGVFGKGLLFCLPHPKIRYFYFQELVVSYLSAHTPIPSSMLVELREILIFLMADILHFHDGKVPCLRWCSDICKVSPLESGHN